METLARHAGREESGRGRASASIGSWVGRRGDRRVEWLHDRLESRLGGERVRRLREVRDLPCGGVQDLAGQLSREDGAHAPGRSAEGRARQLGQGRQGQRRPDQGQHRRQGVRAGRRAARGRLEVEAAVPGQEPGDRQPPVPGQAVEPLQQGVGRLRPEERLGDPVLDMPRHRLSDHVVRPEEPGGDEGRDVREEHRLRSVPRAGREARGIGQEG